MSAIRPSRQGLRNVVLPRHGRFDPAGKVALVTGGGDGIGLATARLLRAKGSRVVVVDRDEAAAKQAAADLGGDTLSIVADVTDRAAMRDAVARTVDHFGRLDLVVANAGITPPPATLRQVDPADFERVLDVNLVGVLNTIQPAVDHLIASQGHVVVVASAAAFSPPIGSAVYMISKAAVEALSRGFKLELAPHGVTVTTSYFGFVDTQLARTSLDDDPVGKEVDAMLPGPLRRRITPDQAAGTIVNAVEHRAPSSIAPRAWQPLGIFRGSVSPVLDRYLTADPKTHELIHKLESRRVKPS